MEFEVVCSHCGGLVPAEVPEPAMAGSSGSGSAEVDAGAIDWVPLPGSVADRSLLGSSASASASASTTLPAADWGSGADLIAAPSPDLEPGSGPAGGSPEPAFALDLNPSRSPAPALAPEGASAEVEAGEPRGFGWPNLLLASYASATTLAIFYLLWQGPRRQPGPESLPVDTHAGGGVVAPLARERIARLGEPQRVGSLEWTPLEIRRGRVRLRRPNGRRGEGAPGSLILRLRLRNLSTTDTFAPMEAAFARRPDQGPPDALVVAEGGDAPPLEPYPLALQSEQSLDGQSFGPLKPGEERELIVATEPLDPPRELGPSLWRLRLRVSPSQTEVVGVRFAPGEIR